MSTKFDLKHVVFNTGPWGFSDPNQDALPFSSGAIKNKTSTIPQKPSNQQKKEENESKTAKQNILLYKSMEKTIHRLKNKAARDAFVEAELVNGISTQIRVLRQQRCWTQKDLAKKLGTSQGVVSRLEDPSYGRFSVKTLVDIASIFDVSLLTRFVPFSVMVAATWDTSVERLEAESFDSEMGRIQFVSKDENRYLSNVRSTADLDDFSKNYFEIEHVVDEHSELGGKNVHDAGVKYFTRA